MWPFSKKHKPLSELPGITAEAIQWRMAQSSNQQRPLIMRYNHTARDWLGHPELPIRLGFAVPLNHPNPGGLPDPEENEQLNDIEDILVRELEARTRGILAMVLTTGELKEFVFYIALGADIKNLHETVQSLVPSHEVQCIALQDAKWSFYKDMVPA